MESLSLIDDLVRHKAEYFTTGYRVEAVQHTVVRADVYDGVASSMCSEETRIQVRNRIRRLITIDRAWLTDENQPRPSGLERQIME